MSEENRSFQWIKGEHQGIVERATAEEHDTWLYFESGRRINKSILNEILVEATEDTTIPFDPIENKPIPQVSKKSSAPTSAVHSPVDNVIGSLKPTSLVNESVNISIKISIPKTEVYNLLQESFGEDVFESIYKGAIEKLDLQALKEELEKNVQKKLKSLYKI